MRSGIHTFCFWGVFSCFLSLFGLEFPFWGNSSRFIGNIVTRKPFPSSVTNTSGVLQLIHSNLSGMLPVTSLGICSYYITFIDDFSRKTWIYFLKKGLKKQPQNKTSWCWNNKKDCCVTLLTHCNNKIKDNILGHWKIVKF